MASAIPYVDDSDSRGWNFRADEILNFELMLYDAETLEDLKMR